MGLVQPRFRQASQNWDLLFALFNFFNQCIIFRFSSAKGWFKARLGGGGWGDGGGLLVMERQASIVPLIYSLEDGDEEKHLNCG